MPQTPTRSAQAGSEYSTLDGEIIQMLVGRGPGNVENLLEKHPPSDWRESLPPPSFLFASFSTLVCVVLGVGIPA